MQKKSKESDMLSKSVLAEMCLVIRAMDAGANMVSSYPAG